MTVNWPRLPPFRGQFLCKLYRISRSVLHGPGARPSRRGGRSAARCHALVAGLVQCAQPPRRLVGGAYLKRLGGFAPAARGYVANLAAGGHVVACAEHPPARNRCVASPSRRHACPCDRPIATFSHLMHAPPPTSRASFPASGRINRLGQRQSSR